MKHLESFGSAAHYRTLILLVESSPKLWRKVANMLNTIRRDLRSWPHIDPNNQQREVNAYIRNALKDTKFTHEVMVALIQGINSEFQFSIEVPTLDNTTQSTTL